MKTCLIVDDIDFNRAKATVLLKGLGFNVETARCAAEVGMYFEKHGKQDINNISVVLMDWHIPGVDGVKMVELIKQVHSNIIVFLYTAVGDDQEGQTLAKMAGADGFISKQLSKEKLIKAFKEKGLF